jgi:hypothetical protein
VIQLFVHGIHITLLTSRGGLGSLTLEFGALGNG